MTIASRPQYGHVNARAERDGSVRFTDDFEKFIDDLMRDQSADGVTYVSVTGNFSPDPENQFIEVDASGGDVTITMPTPSDVFDAGAEIAISKVDATSNTVTVVGQINSSTSKIIRRQWSVMNLRSNSDRFRIA